MNITEKYNTGDVSIVRVITGASHELRTFWFNVNLFHPINPFQSGVTFHIEISQ